VGSKHNNTWPAQATDGELFPKSTAWFSTHTTAGLLYIMSVRVYQDPACWNLRENASWGLANLCEGHDEGVGREGGAQMHQVKAFML